MVETRIKRRRYDPAVNLRGQTKYKAKIRLEVFKNYGMVCACCGEDDYKALTIDHVNNNGAEHRKVLRGKTIYSWLRKQNYPAGYQTLCFNCNCIKGFKNKGQMPEWRRNKYTRPNTYS